MTPLTVAVRVLAVPAVVAVNVTVVPVPGTTGLADYFKVVVVPFRVDWLSEPVLAVKLVAGLGVYLATIEVVPVVVNK